MKPLFKKSKPLPLPKGCTEKDVATESSVCTGETVIGFRDSSGRLSSAVVCRSQADLLAFYRAYGLTPPKGEKRPPFQKSK